jgi:hypothetical protein
MRETFELKIFERNDHFNKRKWFELTELKSGEVIFEHELQERVLNYAEEFVKLRPGQYKLLKN